MITWILVAQRAGAQFFEHRGPGKGLQQISELFNAQGRARDREVDSDRPGRAFDRHGQGRHAMGKHESPHEHIAAQFARRLASEVDTARVEGKFDQFIVVAEPKMLGLIRQALAPATKLKLHGCVAKDYAPEDRPHLERALEPYIAI